MEKKWSKKMKSIHSFFSFGKKKKKNENVKKKKNSRKKILNNSNGRVTD